ncbi:hypothetical protein [Enterococcus phage vB_EfaS_140]|uniref:Uncharacterized protein n=1 Tax=Enterococcus phage vB_EfaS_140 TaxID=2730536 RepID=A0ACA9ASJ4_9CAUD|nr:hypothetical protein [Enterococcus phage vB_EfaS_140]
MFTPEKQDNFKGEYPMEFSILQVSFLALSVASYENNSKYGSP